MDFFSDVRSLLFRKLMDTLVEFRVPLIAFRMTSGTAYPASGFQLVASPPRMLKEKILTPCLFALDSFDKLTLDSSTCFRWAFGCKKSLRN